MNVNKVLTKEYEKKDTWLSGKNEPKTNPIRTQTNPIKANFKIVKMKVNEVLSKDYEKKSNWAIYENEPNSKPIYRGEASGEAGSKAKKCCSTPFCCGISKEKMIFCNLINKKSQFERI